MQSCDVVFNRGPRAICLCVCRLHRRIQSPKGPTVVEIWYSTPTTLKLVQLKEINKMSLRSWWLLFAHAVNKNEKQILNVASTFLALYWKLTTKCTIYNIAFSCDLFLVLLVLFLDAKAVCTSVRSFATDLGGGKIPRMDPKPIKHLFAVNKGLASSFLC